MNVAASVRSQLAGRGFFASFAFWIVATWGSLARAESEAHVKMKASCYEVSHALMTASCYEEARVLMTASCFEDARRTVSRWG